MIRILIFDDQYTICNSIKEIIGRKKNMSVTINNPDISKTLELISENAFDLVIIDISKPEYAGFYFLEQIQLRKPNLPTLMLSELQEDIFPLLSYKCGANGYLYKGDIEDELIVAINEIIHHRKFFKNKNTLRPIEI